jgi:hypothetical protein
MMLRPTFALLVTLLAAAPSLAEEEFDRVIALRPALADSRDALHPLALGIATYERTPGDASPVYHQALLSLPVADDGLGEESLATKFNVAQEQKPGDLNHELFREVLGEYKFALDFAALAARRSSNGMQTTVRDRGLDAVLPQLNPARVVAIAACMRANLAADEGRWEDWAADIATVLRLSEQLAAHDEAVLVEGLVAAGIGGLALETILNADAVEGRPNLYWAMSAVDLDLDFLRFIQAETVWITSTMPQLADPEAMNASRFAELVETMGRIDAMEGDEQSPLARMAANTAAAAFLLAQARPWLLEHGGYREVDLETMPKFEMIARYLKQSVDDAYAELFKIALMPLPEALAAADALEERIQDPSYGSVLVSIIAPSVSRSRLSLVAVERRRAGIIVVDALRDYLAKHGELPGSLEDVDLPLPTDPATNETFVYERLDNGSATLEAVTLQDASDRYSWTWKLEPASE